MKVYFYSPFTINDLEKSETIAGQDRFMFETTNGETKSIDYQTLGNLLGGGNPVGSIISVMGLHAPDGYLILDGSEYNIADYPRLSDYFLNELGKKDYFGGDGTNTFAVPDLRGEFIRGYDPDHIRDNVFSRETHELGKHQDATEHVFIEQHNALQIGGTTQDTDSYAKKADNYIMGNRHAKLNDDAFESVNIAAYYTSRPTNVSVLFCIKY